MRHDRTRRIGTIAAVTALLAGVGACSSDSAEDEAPAAAADETETADSEPTDEADSADETDEATADADEGSDAGQAAWAAALNTEGDQIATVEVGDVTVDVLQVGTTEATKPGTWMDPDTEEPIIDEGDEIVYVRYVVTNQGDDIDLGSTLVDISPRYADWEYMQGMGGVTDFDLDEEMGVETSAIGEVADPTVYTLAAGEAYSVGQNFHYQAGSELEISATITPVDGDGELLHDDKIEGEASGTIE